MTQDAVPGSLLNGDGAAWKGFVRRYGGLIVAAVRGVAPVAGDIEDLTQEVFVRLCKDDFRLLRTYDPARAALSTWLTIVARSTARDALRRIKESGVSRRIVGVEIDGDRLPTLNFVTWPVTVRGERVGKVTSAVYSPRLKRNIGYAWVPVQLSELGTQLDVESEWGGRTATVVPMPFWDPEKQIPVS